MQKQKLPLLLRAKKNNGRHSSDLKSSSAIAGLLFCFLAVPFFLTACADSSGQLTASLGKRFSLAVNQTAVIASENLTITFQNISDSRCPIGVVCIWAGEARADIIIGTDTLTLVEPGHSANNTQPYKNYVLTFEVTPYPAANKMIEQKDYRLLLVVDKGN